jgi:hypothetical protein
MNRMVQLSHRFYCALLRAYPPNFRREFGHEMALVFRDSCRAAHRRRGGVGVLGQWGQTIPDMVVSVVDEHAQENFKMAKASLVRLLAGAGIVGGALWIAFGVLTALRPPGIPGGMYRDVDDIAPLLIAALGLGAAGLLGVVLAPGRGWHVATRVFVLLAAGGGLWSAVSPLFTDLWYVMIAGYMLQMLCLVGAGSTLVGAAATRSWAILFIVMALSMSSFNTEDGRAWLGVAVGALAIVISALVLGDALGRRAEPPVAAG